MSGRALAVPGLVLAALSWGLPASTQPLPPDQCRAIPDYGDNSIIVEWNDVEAELGYRVFRAEDLAGPYVQLGLDLPPDTVTLIDPGRLPGLEYFYLVRAFDEVGESLDSNVFQQNVNIVWPNPAGESLLHNWNETIGSAATEGFHKGCDIQQVGEVQNEVIFPRGGVVVRVGWASKDNNHIYIEVKIGTEFRYDSFNHLDGNKVTDMGYDVGDYVRAGQPLTELGDRLFTFYSLDFVDHTHYFAPLDPFTNEVDGQHPLKIFLADQEKDPLDTRPGLHDHGLLSDGPVIYHRQGAAAGPPYLQPPLGDDRSTPGEDEGDVDIHVEIADTMGLGTTSVPTSVAWWIEGRACDGGPAVVRDAASPYVLFDWDDRLFRGSGIDFRHLVDESQDLAPFITYDEVLYPETWNNFKHFILTNTIGTDGAPEQVDETQYWNTDAADDGSAVTDPGANLAGQPDATRAAEARFPDGDYAIHVTSTDLLGGQADSIQGVRLENFPPAVSWSGIEGPDRFRFEFSEPMTTTAVEGSVAIWLTGDGLVNHTPLWDPFGCSITLVLDQPIESCPQYEITFDADLALDLEGRPLDGAFPDPNHDGVSQGAPYDSARTRFSVDGATEVTGVAVSSQPGGPATITWMPASGATVHAVLRGALDELGIGEYGACLQSGLVATEHQDADLPAPGAGFFYLVQGWNDTCGAGPLGRDSAGDDRVDLDSDGCW